MADYIPTIGLEVHAELNTRTKMFCDSLNDPDEKTPNKNTCPVCLGHPGSLPTINRQAVEFVITAGLAIDGAINPITKFDRKNYFYPDLPKGYQISQYDKPLVVGGRLNGVAVTRIHLEEDAGKLLHAPDGKSTLVDFNRASVPLMELVTEPVIKDAKEAVAFMKELQLLLRYLGVSDADLERGQMRADANVSVSNDGTLGTRVEIKNLNSFRSVEDAVNYEIKRQSEVRAAGGTIDQETRGWDDVKRVTVVQRSKEQAHDYRYFPEPDLPPFATAEFGIEELRASLPELPRAKQERFMREFGLAEKQARQLAEDKALAEFFEEAESELATRDEASTSAVAANAQNLLFNYLTSDLSGLLNEMGTPLGKCKVNPAELAHLVDLITDGKIMSRQAKDILRKMAETGEDPGTILESEGLHTVSDEASLKIVIEETLTPELKQDIWKENIEGVERVVGLVMRALNGRGDPEKIRNIAKMEVAVATDSSLLATEGTTAVLRDIKIPGSRKDKDKDKVLQGGSDTESESPFDLKDLVGSGSLQER